jgi:SAM-dependent methyltransferase
MGHRNQSASGHGRLAAAGVWENVLGLAGGCNGQKILDCPAGSGKLAEKLRSMGAEVFELDLSTYHFSRCNRLQGDLNRYLPYKNNVFDKIISVEGIEHIENPTALIREFSRILKIGGDLILTTPNILNIRSRIKFLLTGCLFWFGKIAIGKYGHLTPISFYHLEHLCSISGFKTVGIFFNRRPLWMRLLSPIIQISGLIFKEKFNQGNILSGEILILKLVKTSSINLI